MERNLCLPEILNERSLYRITQRVALYLPIGDLGSAVDVVIANPISHHDIASLYTCAEGATYAYIED